MIKNPDLKVKTHVGRDLLQSAALFKTDKHVIWEYVANSLQYIDAGTVPHIVVKTHKKNKISIQDNGRGMDWQGLANFFIMHGENIDKKQGKAGRGMFGTGKSAAFGIAEILRITTVRSGKRSCVQLDRKKIEALTSGEEILVDVMEKEKLTNESNGTLIEIENVYLRTFDVPGIIHFIERNLGHSRKDVVVFVNQHQCEYNEPAIAKTFEFKPEEQVREKLGDVKLIVKVAKVPLTEDLRGIQIWSNGQLLETTLAEVEGRDLSHYIFGEIDVPCLYEDKSPIPPFDMSRSKHLNPQNDLVAIIFAFIGRKIEEVRKILVQEEKERKADEEAKKLSKQADEIADILNQDFNAFRNQLAKVRAKAFGGHDFSSRDSLAGKTDDDLLLGDFLPAEIIQDKGSIGSNGDNGNGGDKKRKLKPVVEPGTPESEKKGQEAGGTNGTKKRPSGGFKIEYKHIGEDECRATYRSEERTIYINLDHPQIVAAAKGDGSMENIQFRRLSYEIAFAEYAVAICSELANRAQIIDILDAIDEIRDAMDRLSRKAASLYS